MKLELLLGGLLRDGVLLPTDLVDGSTDKTVMDVLKEKQPDSGMTDVSVCLEDDDLPVVMDVDVTGGHIERLARALHGAGPGGTTFSHWQSFLLCYGAQSAKLRDAVGALTCLLANGIVNWDMICAMLSSRLIALNKNPGIQPIGVGEVLRRLLGKAMVLATGIDVEELCGADQLCSGLKGENVKMKVQSWVDSVYCLSDAAKQQPQAAYAALVKSIQCEWAFLQRVVVKCSELFLALKDAIREAFWPSLFGSVVSHSEADLFALPTRMGGMRCTN